MKMNLNEITRQYLLAKAVDDALYNPTLKELIEDYTPRFTRNGLIWTKKPTTLQE